jgi:hypothetical protein
MVEPCIKGTLFQNLAGELLELIQAGELDEQAVDRALKPDERQLLDADVSIRAWYPIVLYDRMLRLYKSAAPFDADGFLTRSGRRSAMRVVELGIYSQLDTHTLDSWENRVGRILVTLSGSFFNFGRWEWQGIERHGFSILVRDAAPISDDLALRTGGFIEYLATRAAGGAVALTHQRQGNAGDLLFRARRVD